MIAMLLVSAAISSGGHTQALHNRDVWKDRFTHLPSSERVWAKSTSSCETGGTFDPAIHSPSGTYHGAFQFSLSTARAAGFTKDPHKTSWFQQAVRSVRWKHKAGAGQWPVCG